MVIISYFRLGYEINRQMHQQTRKLFSMNQQQEISPDECVPDGLDIVEA